MVQSSSIAFVQINNIRNGANAGTKSNGKHHNRKPIEFQLLPKLSVKFFIKYFHGIINLIKLYGKCRVYIRLFYDLNHINLLPMISKKLLLEYNAKLKPFDKNEMVFKVNEIPRFYFQIEIGEVKLFNMNKEEKVYPFYFSKIEV